MCCGTHGSHHPCTDVNVAQRISARAGHRSGRSAEHVLFRALTPTDLSAELRRQSALSDFHITLGGTACSRHRKNG